MNDFILLCGTASY